MVYGAAHDNYRALVSVKLLLKIIKLHFSIYKNMFTVIQINVMISFNNYIT
jgi:hypothetical protein